MTGTCAMPNSQFLTDEDLSMAVTSAPARSAPRAGRPHRSPNGRRRSPDSTARAASRRRRTSRSRATRPARPERAALKARLAAMASERVDIPIIIGGKDIRTGDPAQSVMPHDHQHVLGDWHKATTQARPAGDRRGARSARRLGRTGRGKIAPRCSSRPPSCSPRRGARRSTRRRCSANRRRRSRPRSTRRAS